MEAEVAVPVEGVPEDKEEEVELLEDLEEGVI